ncbi:MAG: purine-nucleoside phosphorylase [Myxococcota bacterium]
MQTGDASATTQHTNPQAAPPDLAERVAEAARCVGEKMDSCFRRNDKVGGNDKEGDHGTTGHRAPSKNIVTQRFSKQAHAVGVVLGSGLGEFADSLLADDPHGRAIDYADIPHFAPSRVAGHTGRLVLAHVHNRPVLLLQGRTHCYEGHPAWQAALPIRVLRALGVRCLVLTGAAGGVSGQLQPGDLMLITDQINLSGQNPLVGPNDSGIGPRFPDMTECYCQKLQKRARHIARDLCIPLKEGVYASVLGPSYETPAEVRMLRTLGADAVAMSIGMETLAARHSGMRVLGIACITNKAAGLSGGPLTHQEVQAVAAASKQRFTRLLQALLTTD